MADRMTLILELGAMAKQAEKRGDNPSAVTLRATVAFLIADQSAVERDSERRKGQRDRKQRSREVTLSHGTSRDVTLESVTESQGFPGPLPNSKTTTPPPIARVWASEKESDLADQLTTDAGRNALTAVLLVASTKTAVVGEIEACMNGARGAAFKANGAQLDVALSDYVANGLTRGVWNANHFRAFIQKAVEGPRPPPPPRAGKFRPPVAPVGVPAPPSDPDVAPKWQT